MTTMLLRANLNWQVEAACRGMNPGMFVPDDFEVPDQRALAACRRCPVREQCLDWALIHDEVGIWGGLTDEQRRKITINRSRVYCPDCGGDNIMDRDRFEVCLSCGLSWPI